MRTRLVAWTLISCLLACGSHDSEDDAMGIGEIGRKVKGWQQSSTLHAGDPTKRFTMQANFEEADYYTVQFGVILPDGTPLVNAADYIPTSVPIVAPRAKISWSVEGQTVARLLDVGNGTTISGPGQAARIEAYDAAVIAKNSPAYGARYKLSAQISKGARPSINKPPTLRDATYLLAPASPVVVVPLPILAGVISVEITCLYFGDTGGANVNPRLTVTQSNGLPTGLVLKTYNAFQYGGFVPIDPAAQYIQLQNEGTANVRATVTWGIDG